LEIFRVKSFFLVKQLLPVRYRPHATRNPHTTDEGMTFDRKGFEHREWALSACRESDSASDGCRIPHEFIPVAITSFVPLFYAEKEKQKIVGSI
jgi:hypothetical protein